MSSGSEGEACNSGGSVASDESMDSEGFDTGSLFHTDVSDSWRELVPSQDEESEGSGGSAFSTDVRDTESPEAQCVSIDDGAFGAAPVKVGGIIKSTSRAPKDVEQTM